MPYKNKEDRKAQMLRWTRANKDNPVRKKKDGIRAIARYIHKKPKRCSIKNCKTIGERHHPDYDKPLEIIWLCRKHHSQLHKPLPKLCSIEGCKEIVRARKVCNTHYMFWHLKWRRGQITEEEWNKRVPLTTNK